MGPIHPSPSYCYYHSTFPPLPPPTFPHNRLTFPSLHLKLQPTVNNIANPENKIEGSLEMIIDENLTDSRAYFLTISESAPDY